MKNEERTWWIIGACVPRGTSAKLARSLSRTIETINSWRRRPPDDDIDNPIANPMDWVEAIQDHAFAHAPDEAYRIHAYFQKRYEDHVSLLKKNIPEAGWLTELATDYSAALNKLLTEAPPERVRKEWVDLRDAVERTVAWRERTKGEIARVK